MLENPDFEQNHYSKPAIGIDKIGQDNIRLMKWIAFYDRSFFEKINYYDMMGYICKNLIKNEISEL